MEPAPLTQAHAHARAAFSHQAQLSDISTASEEHALAAGEFAQAAKGTGDAEVSVLWGSKASSSHNRC